MWSFGCVIYALFNQGRSPIQAHDTVAGYIDASRRLDAITYSNVPSPAKTASLPPPKVAVDAFADPPSAFF